jgi:hypothetical protein
MISRRAGQDGPSGAVQVMGMLRRPPGGFGRLKPVSANERDEPTIEPGRSQDCAGQSVSLAAGKFTGRQLLGAVMVCDAPAGVLA